MTEPRIVRNFKILEEIGTGGMGVIYRAIQTTLDRPVAFKELHPHLAKDKDFIRRFEREAKTAATLQHENIVSVIDFGQEGANYFIAMEYVEGGDLKALLARAPKIALPIAITIALDVLRGLEHAHSRGIVHRDIKPANIMITKDGSAKIADFSIAQGSTMPSVTMTGAMVGTPAYMSPEQVAGSPVDARTDLFSLGVILYEMLGGQRPFEGPTYATIVTRLLTVTPPEITEIDPFCPASIGRVIRRALEKDPDRRYQNAGEIARDLENAARDERIDLGRRLVVDYVRDPANFQAALHERQAKDAYQRGLFLMNQGLSRIDDAIRSLELATLLDPNNGDAKTRLTVLKERKGRSPTKAPPSSARKAEPGTRAPVAILALIGALTLVLGALAWHFGIPGRQAPTPLPIVIASPIRTPTTVVQTPPPTPTAVAIASLAPSPTRVAIAPTPRPTAKPTSTAPSIGTIPRVGTPVPTSTPAAVQPVATPVDEDLVDPELAAQNKGVLHLRQVLPWAKVFLDGKYLETTPIAAPITLPVGAHQLELQNPEYAPVVETIQIQPGKTLVLSFTLKPKS